MPSTTAVDERLRDFALVSHRRVVAERLEQLLDEARDALTTASTLAELERLDTPWLGGLDVPTLAREIDTAARAAGDLANDLDRAEVELLEQLRVDA